MQTQVAVEKGRTRRARYLIPRDLPRRGEALAATAVVVVLVHVLFAQLTGVIAVACHITGRSTRWRPSWLAAPAAVGLIWTLAVGGGAAVAGLLAGPAHVLSYITGGGSPFAHLTRPLGAFGGIGEWLPRQLPLALVTGSAEAAVAWLYTDPARWRPSRPGALATLRRAVNLRRLRVDELLARGAAALGVDPATGAPAGLSWTDVTGGVLVTGELESDVSATALRLTRAALRRRKPVLVIDLERRAGIVSRLREACARSGNQLNTEADIGAVVRNRAVALFAVAGDAGTAASVCAAVLETCRELRRIGVDGDGLVWLRGCEGLSASLIASLVTEGASAGLPLVISTTDPAAAAAVAPMVAAVARHRDGFTLTVRGRQPVRVVTS